MIQTILPKDESHWLQLRTEDITSTDVAALFGLSPYQTKFELWHRKNDKTVVQLEQNERMLWGTRLQDAIAAGIAEEQNWKIKRMTEYIRNPQTRIGSSFDFSIESGGILEIKNVDSLAFRDGWLVDEEDNIEAPPHIELQVQHQLAVSGRDIAHIGALVGGNKLVLIKRERDDKVINSIQNEVSKFWKSIEDKKPPEPDFAKDADMIKQIYAFSSPGSMMDARGDQDLFNLAAKYRELSAAEKEIDSEKKAIKSQMLMKIGENEKVIGDGFSISAGNVAPAPIAAFVRAGFRNCRVTWKKGL